MNDNLMITTNNTMIAELINMKMVIKQQENKVTDIEHAIAQIDNLGMTCNIVEITTDLGQLYKKLNKLLEEQLEDVCISYVREEDYTEEYEATFGNSYTVDTLTNRI